MMRLGMSARTASRIIPCLSRKATHLCPMAPPPKKDMIGLRFGRLTVVREASPKRYSKGTKRTFLVKCDCGNQKVVIGASLPNGNTTSCGCLRRERTGELSTTHGGTKNRKWDTEYTIWVGIIARCENPNSRSYERYGGRGITICPEWRHDYAAFLAHVGRRPSQVHSIDRIDNNRGYEPGNVRWATSDIQRNNTRRNKFMTVRGERKTIMEWAVAIGISHYGMTKRLKSGWSEEKAATTPVRHFKTKPPDPASRASAKQNK